MKKELCPECHNRLKVDKFIDATVIVFKCKFCNKTFKITYDEVVVPPNIKSFNWGAFLLGGYWGFGNGSIGYATTIWILGMLSNNNILSLICSPVILGLSFYYGIRGNRISWIKKDWSSIEYFERVQKRWSIVVWVFVLIISTIFAIIVFNM